MTNSFSDVIITVKMQSDYYILKHCDDNVALLDISNETGQILEVLRIIDDSLLPIGIFPGNNGMELKQWWKERAIPMTRYGIDKVLQYFGYSDTANLLLMTRGLNLTDHYWVCPVDANLQWGDINFFDNDFSSDFEDMFIDSSIVAGDFSQVTPSASAVGEMQKKWIIVNGERAMLKLSLNNSQQQCVNEIIATELHKRLGFTNYVTYAEHQLSVGSEQVYASCCRAFTSNNIEFVSAHQLLQNLKTPNDKSNFEFLIEVAVALGCDSEEIRQQLEYQILTDFILSNTDRHYNNFGFLKLSSENQNLFGMAPIFDTGNSLFYNEEFIPSNLLEIKANSFCNREVDMLRLVSSGLKLDLDKLRDFDEVVFQLLLHYVDPNRARKIADTVRLKLEYLEEFQSGKKIWKPRKYW